MGSVTLETIVIAGKVGLIVIQAIIAIIGAL